MAYPLSALCLTLLLVFPVPHFATPFDEDTAGPSGHAPAPPVMTVSERYLAGLESRIQTAAKTLSLLQKRFNNRKDDPTAAAEVKTDLDAARSHLHELEGRLDAYMLETSRPRPDQPDQHSSGKQPAPSRASRKRSTDGSDEEEDDTHGHARPRALPRTLPVPRDGYLDKSGKINRIYAQTILTPCPCCTGRCGLFMNR
jgi:FtsZ-binding cell division protein ZapB